MMYKVDDGRSVVSGNIIKVKVKRSEITALFQSMNKAVCET